MPNYIQLYCISKDYTPIEPPSYEQFGPSCQAVCTPPETVTDRGERVARLTPLVARHTVAPSEAIGLRMFSSDWLEV